MEKKVKIKISGEPVEKADIKIVRGYVVMPDQFDEVFENADEIYRYFDSDVLLGAVVSEYERSLHYLSATSDTRRYIHISNCIRVRHRVTLFSLLLFLSSSPLFRC
jgi:hypothetical protein